MKEVNDLFGLVVCGGQSIRMGVDKSLLDYHGKPQRYYLYDMQTTLFGKAFISCNEAQSKEMPEGYNVIIDSDKYNQVGPMAGLLSAFEKYPETSFLVTGCDYPFTSAADLQKLVDSFHDVKLALTYYNDKEQIREPLLGLYKPGCYPYLLSQYQDQNYSLNHFLKAVNADNILPSAPEIIQSIDRPEQYQNALITINAQKA